MDDDDDGHLIIPLRSCLGSFTGVKLTFSFQVVSAGFQHFPNVVLENVNAARGTSSFDKLRASTVDLNYFFY